MRAKFINEENFEREGNSLRKLNIGKRILIKDFLLDSEDEFKENVKRMPEILEGVKEWLESNKSLAKALHWKKTKEDIFNILSFDEDYWLETKDIDSEDLKKEFRVISAFYHTDNEVSWQIGKLEDDSLVLYYQNSSISGYITRKEWLK